MKVNKAGFIVSIVLTVVFVALGIVVMLLPKSVSPLTVTSDLVMSKSYNTLYINGKVKNDSERQLTISKMTFTVTTSDTTYELYVADNVTLQAGEEYEISVYDDTFYSTPRTLTEFSAVIDGKTYTVYSSVNDMLILTIVMFAFAAIFAIISVTSVFALKKQQKRVDAIIADLSKMECNAQYYIGAYGGKGETGKAVAQTAVSAVGGAIFAGLFGFGAFKVYGANNASEFVVTDDGIFVGKPNKYGFSLNNMAFMEKSTFQNASLTVKKKFVLMKNGATGEYFKLFTKNSGTTSEQLADRLNGFITLSQAIGMSPVAVGAVSEGNNAPPADPFAD